MTWKPVPKMIASTCRSTPSAVTSRPVAISLIPVVTTSALGRLSAGQ